MHVVKTTNPTYQKIINDSFKKQQVDMENNSGQHEEVILLPENNGNEGTPTETVQETIQLTDRDVFTKLWTSPRKVFRFILENKYDKYMYILLFLAGVESALNRASSSNLGDHSHLIFILIGSLTVGGVFGWLTFYIYNALLSWTGKWLKGTANTNTLFRIFTYSVVPSVLSLVFLFIEIILFGNGVFQTDFDYLAMGIPAAIFFMIISTIQITLSIWSVVLLVIGISEVQHFSIGKSIVSLLIPAFLIIIPVMVIVLLT
jgi:hypothetical protein